MVPAQLWRARAGDEQTPGGNAKRTCQLESDRRAQTVAEERERPVEIRIDDGPQL